MPTFVLYVKAELENVAQLSIDKGHSFCMTVKDSSSDDQREGVYVTAAEVHDLSGSKGVANFVMKWAKDSRKEASINVMEIKGVTRAVTADDDNQFVPIMAFECRGIEPVSFTPGGDWQVQSTGGRKFEDVDLNEKEWCDFDDKAGVSVGVYGFESKFQVHKGK